MDEARYSVVEAATVADMQAATASLWIRNGWLGSPSDRLAHVAGATTLLSKRTVSALCIAAALRRLGAHPELACKAARTFTDISDPLEAPGFTRYPGELFSGSFTMLVAFPGGETRIVRTAGIERKKFDRETRRRTTQIEKPSVEDLYAEISQRGGGWLLALDGIVKHVESSLLKLNAACGTVN